MKKMVSVMLETALAIALACVGIGAAKLKTDDRFAAIDDLAV